MRLSHTMQKMQERGGTHEIHSGAQNLYNSTWPPESISEPPLPDTPPQLQSTRALVWVCGFSFRTVLLVFRASTSSVLLPLCNRVILEDFSVSVLVSLLKQYVLSNTQEQRHKTVLNFSFCCCFSSNVYLREGTC